MYTPFPWHPVQGTAICAPVSLKAVVLWSNEAGRHAVVEWHTTHAVRNPVCFGFAALVKAWLWHP